MQILNRFNIHKICTKNSQTVFDMIIIQAKSEHLYSTLVIFSHSFYTIIARFHQCFRKISVIFQSDYSCNIVGIKLESRQNQIRIMSNSSRKQVEFPLELKYLVMFQYDTIIAKFHQCFR